MLYLKEKETWLLCLSIEAKTPSLSWWWHNDDDDDDDDDDLIMMMVSSTPSSSLIIFTISVHQTPRVAEYIPINNHNVVYISHDNRGYKGTKKNFGNSTTRLRKYSQWAFGFFFPGISPPALWSKSTLQTQKVKKT